MMLATPARWVIYTGILSFGLCGCQATVNQSIPFAYTPSLVSHSTIEARVGFEKCEDARGPKTGAKMTFVKDVPEHVSDQILLDLRGSQFFSRLDDPGDKSQDPLLLQCRIQTFVFQPHPSVLTYIPVVGSLIMMFGAPACHPAGEVDLHLKLVDAKGNIVGDYDRTAVKKTWYTSYRGVECSNMILLAEAFKDAMDQLKQDILKDKTKLEKHSLNSK